MKLIKFTLNESKLDEVTKILATCNVASINYWTVNSKNLLDSTKTKNLVVEFSCSDRSWNLIESSLTLLKSNSMLLYKIVVQNVASELYLS